MDMVNRKTNIVIFRESAQGRVSKAYDCEGMLTAGFLRTESGGMKPILYILLYVWQLPQIILGEILSLYYGARKGHDYRGVRLHYSPSIPGGISLGRHIIINGRNRNDEYEKMHEWGHTRQSLMLGWLYLAVIGLPSILWASRPRRDYFSFWTERWADTLGGVRR